MDNAIGDTAAQRRAMLIRYHSTKKRLWQAARTRQLTPAEVHYLCELSEVRREMIEPAVKVDRQLMFDKESVKRLKVEINALKTGVALTQGQQDHLARMEATLLRLTGEKEIAAVNGVRTVLRRKAA